ncbi:MAG: T9SS type A sorting domain-containing protein [candidate division KSB1 bacterium]|nr:T9SS type A sorting domain-containing protein [candidate division KSB1 bacterium]
MKQTLRISLALLWLGSIAFSQQPAKSPTFLKSHPSVRFVPHLSMKPLPAADIAAAEQTSWRLRLPDTLSVVALRVQFQRDNDRNTTGDGWFDLSVGDSMINPPPHNRKYFFNQLRALQDYYYKVSQGRLFLQIADASGEGFVYPLAVDSAWTLPHPMSYYNPNATQSLLDQRLAELFRDAVMLADASGQVDFSKFDVVIVFHAGVGAEFTQDFDTTPNDIPSVFLNFEDLRKTIGNNASEFAGIPVNQSSCFVREGIILPETENQSGYKSFGLVGTAALMMGNQLGLPSLFDTDTGRPGIGRFGLMDQGSGNFFGNIPAQPCAWSKIFLGWEQPITVSAGKNLPVAATLAANPNKIYKIPINAKEYFLLENRQQHVIQKRNIGVGYDENGTRIEFYEDGTYSPTHGIGVIVSIDEYDYGLPGSGILIWHIDESVIAEQYVANRVNTDREHRGVDLVEADGSQDMGYFYNNFGFTGYHAGYAEDMWWNKNEIHLLANAASQVMFTPVTMPSTESYARANTGIYITDFSDIDSVMYFTLEIKNYLSGFPAFLGNNSGNSAVVTGDLNSDGTDELLVSTLDGKILAWKGNGEKFIANLDSANQTQLNGEMIRRPLAVFAEIDAGTLPFPPALADLNHNDHLDVIAGASSGWVYAWQSVDQDGDGRADLLFKSHLGAAVTTAAMISDWLPASTGFEITVGSENGNVCVLDEAGRIIWNKHIAAAPVTGVVALIDGLVAVASDGSLCRIDVNGVIRSQLSLASFGALGAPVVGDVNNDGRLEIIISSTSGAVLLVEERGEALSFSPLIEAGCPLSNPALADIDGDGYLEIVLTGGGRIFAFRFNGVSLSNFPVTFERGFETERYPDPILVDLDGDKKVEIIVGAKRQVLVAVDAQGHRVPGFPLSTSHAIIAAAGVGNLSDTGKFHVIARSTDDFCYVWPRDQYFVADQIYWGQYLKDARHSAAYLAATAPIAATGKLMPEKTVYNYPNPTEGNTTTIRYYLREAATVNIRIYDLAGELVAEFDGPGLPHIENEVAWDLSAVQSGVYLAWVQAKSASETNLTVIKIAVIK